MLDYGELLFRKADQEYKQFINELEGLPPKEIIEKSYEKVIKEDILMIFESAELDPNDARALCKKNNILDFVYQEWLDNDCSIMDMLRDTVDECSKIAIKDLRIISQTER